MNYRGTYALINGLIQPLSAIKKNIGESMDVYEVIRVINSRLLFLDEHLNRLKLSLASVEQSDSFDESTLKIQLADLIHLNRITEGNIRIDFVFSKDRVQIQLAFIEHSYPDNDMFEDGVKLKFYRLNRNNPNVKIQNTILKRERDKAKRDGYYEIILVDEKNQITEGSQSNLFFVSGGSLITAPDSEVLLGVSRAKVIKIAHDMGIPVLYRSVPKDLVAEFDGAFLTGTSINMLPIKRLGRKRYALPNALINQLIEQFNVEVSKDVQ